MSKTNYLMRQYLFLISFLLLSCQKQESNLKPEYFGIWIAETPQFLQTDNRIHTLTLHKSQKSTYTSRGAWNISDVSYSGMALMIPHAFYIEEHLFKIDTIPSLQEDGNIIMYVNGKAFYKQ